jgi:hypothetical protein
MTRVTSIHDSFSTYSEPASEGSGIPVPLDPLAELAALIVQNDFVRSESDEQNLRAAHEAAQRAVAEEVHAMHEAADAIATQAWIQGGLTAAGGAAQCTGSLGQVSNVGEAPATEARSLRWEALGRGGGALGGIAEPLGQFVGGTAKAEAEADAREARGDAEAANSRADEAKQHRQRVERHTDAVLSLVEGTLENEQRTNLAILGNF